MGLKFKVQVQLKIKEGQCVLGYNGTVSDISYSQLEREISESQKGYESFVMTTSENERISINPRMMRESIVCFSLIEND